MRAAEHYSEASHIKDNPLPPGKSNAALAKEFADFFISKILKIRDALDVIAPYQPSDNMGSTFTSFQPLTTDQVKKKVISSMPTKTCESDITKTKLLKNLLETFLSIIQQIVNLSLSEGSFHTE